MSNLHTTKPLQPSEHTFTAGGQPILTFHSDGRMTVSDKLTPDEIGRKVLDTMIEAWPQIVSRAAWQAIKTAPAGQDIILGWAGTSHVRVGYDNGRSWLCDGISFDTDPTHWMPLPDPPMRD